MIFLGVFNHHQLVLAFLDALGVVFDLRFQLSLLFGNDVDSFLKFVPATLYDDQVLFEGCNFLGASVRISS